MVTTIKITCDGVFIQSNPYLTSQSTLNRFRDKKDQLSNELFENTNNQAKINQKVKFKDNYSNSRIYKNYPTKVVRSLSCLTSKEFLLRQDHHRNSGRKKLPPIVVNKNGGLNMLKPTLTKRCTESKIFHLIFGGSAEASSATSASSTLESKSQAAAVAVTAQPKKKTRFLKRSNSTSVAEGNGPFAMLKNGIKNRSKKLVNGSVSLPLSNDKIG